MREDREVDRSAGNIAAEAHAKAADSASAKPMAKKSEANA
jgi:hypothetical protein